MQGVVHCRPFIGVYNGDDLIERRYGELLTLFAGGGSHLLLADSVQHGGRADSRSRV